MVNDILQFKNIRYQVMNIDKDKILLKNIDVINETIEIPIEQFMKEFDKLDCAIEKLQYYHEYDILPLSLKFALKQAKII
jgi:hypothetical protein